MYLQSILITGGNLQLQQKKLQEIFSTFGFPNLPYPPNHPNIFLITPDDDKIAIGIEKIRDLRYWLTIKSTSNLPKVVVIESAETLTESAQNALLKTLEEPPEHTFVILAASRIDFILPTVISRCQIIELSENTKIELTEKENKELLQVLEWIGEGTISKGFAWAKENTDRKSAINQINQLLIIAHRRLLQGSTLQMASEQSKISMIAQYLFEAKKYLSGNCNVRLTLENLFLK